MTYDVEVDEDGVWCAHAQLRPGVGAHGQGEDEAAAVADLREALTGLMLTERTDSDMESRTVKTNGA